MLGDLLLMIGKQPEYEMTNLASYLPCVQFQIKHTDAEIETVFHLRGGVRDLVCCVVSMHSV